MKNLVKITLHGLLGESVGRSDWNLDVKTVGEAIHAIETLSKRKLYKFLFENDKNNVKYRVLINNRDFISEEPLDINKPETLTKSELTMLIPSLKSIDIVPVIEGYDSSTVAIVIGAILIIIGIVLIFTGVGSILGVALIIGGLGLVAAGVINLLSKPPEFEDFREIAGGGRASYLFSGPQNTTREGGPVPVGYGRLIVGSQVISASYELSEVNAALNTITQ